MTQFPPDDQPLVDFLRQHRPLPPPPALDLEQRLLATLGETPQPKGTTVLERSRAVVSRSSRSARSLWLVPPAIVAGLLVTWTAERFWLPSNPSPAEVSSLEAFMENNWQGSVTHEPEFDSGPTNSN